MSLCGGVISKIEKGSLGEELDLAPGDIVTHIDQTVLHDIIDYKLLSDQDRFSLVVKRNGSAKLLKVENRSRKPLGILFESSLFDGLKTCKNKCIFCFVDQLPSDLRKTLYLKDDDYRLSFIYGNFVTFNNLDRTDIERIISCRLSPLYLSLHSTNLEVRSFMMGKSNSQIFDYLQALSQGHISLHVQIVLCPGINDGPVLEQTLNDLLQNYKSVKSVGIVPVGLTRFRQGLHPLRPFVSSELAQIIKQVDTWRKKCLAKEKTRWVYFADEFYLGSGVPLPAAEAYDDFPQIENGIGLARRFCDTVKRDILRGAPARLQGKFLIVTGLLSESLLRSALRPVLENAAGLLEIIPIRNEFFGPRVTVSGLVAGRDLLNQLRGKEANAVLIPEVMLNSDSLFIDDISISRLQEELGMPVKAFPSDGSGLLAYLTEQSPR